MNIFGFLLWDLKLSQAACEREYHKELGSAFPGVDRNRRELIYAYGLYHEKRYAPAMKLLDRLLSRCRTHEDRRAVLLAMALCLEDQGAAAKAEQTYRALLELIPDYATALNNLGLLLKKQGRYLEAEKLFLRAMETGKSRGPIHLNLGLLYFCRGQYEKAIPLLTEAFDLLPTSRNCPGALARCYAALEDMDEAKRWAKLAVQRGRDAAAMEQAFWRTRNMFPDLSNQPPETAETYRNWLSRTGKTSLIMGISPNRSGRSYVGGEALGHAPQDPTGKPMRQLAAIFCEEFPGVGLPDRGLIRIFVADDGDRWGMDPQEPNIQQGFRVLYDREFDHLSSGPQPVGSFPIRGKSWLAISTRVTQPMPACDFRFEAESDGAVTENFRSVLINSYHRVGGYPCCYQPDPRAKAALSKYDQLLLQLDMLEWNGQYLCMKFCIPTEKLAVGDVSDVLYWWDRKEKLC